MLTPTLSTARLAALAPSPTHNGLPVPIAQLRAFAEILREDYPQLAAFVYSIGYAPREQQPGLYEQALQMLDIYATNEQELQTPRDGAAQ